jgi:hypothetical protein
MPEETKDWRGGRGMWIHPVEESVFMEARKGHLRVQLVHVKNGVFFGTEIHAL